MNNWYKWFWSRLGGRPFTYAIRDAYHKGEFFWLVGLVGLGVWLGHNYEWRQVLIGWLIFSAGYLAGHLFWGRDYIENEQGK